MLVSLMVLLLPRNSQLLKVHTKELSFRCTEKPIMDQSSVSKLPYRQLPKTRQLHRKKKKENAIAKQVMTQNRHLDAETKSTFVRTLTRSVVVKEGQIRNTIVLRSSNAIL